MLKHIQSIILSALLIPGLALQAQVPIERVLMPDQLSNPHVNALAEDEEGFIWAGTTRGLNRYNGSTYQYYYQEEGGLINDNISTILPDTDGRLWIGHGSGIQLLKNGAIDPDFRSDAGVVRHLEPMDEGHLLYSNRDGVYVLDKQTGESHPVYQNRRMAFNTFLRTSDAHLWIYDYGSQIITILDNRWRVIREFPLVQMGSDGPVESRNGNVVLPTTRGLLLFETDGTPLPIPTALEGLTRNKPVLFYVSNQESAYIGIQGEGIYEILEDGIPRQRWFSEKLDEDPSCIPLLTRTNLWISKTEETLTNLFLHADDHIIDLPPQYISHMLNSFRRLDAENLLVFTNTELYKQHLGSKEFTPLKGEGIEGGNKLGINLQDRLGYWWIQLNNYELRKYAMDGDRMTLLNRWSIDATSAIWDDASGNVYLLQDEGILRFTQDGRREKLDAGTHPEFWYCGQFDSGRAYFLANDDIWFLGEEGRFYPLESGIPSPSCIYEDSDGEWWIGSRNNGLWKYNPRSRKKERISFGDTGADQNIRSIGADKNGNLWIALRFDYLRMAPNGNITFINSPDHGLSSNYTNSIVVLDDGTPVFGSNTRLIYFPQSEILSAEEPIHPMLDNVFVNGKLYSKEDLLRLDHHTEYIAFYFSGKNFNPDFHPVYQYKLEGFDRDWYYAGSSLRTRYSGLFPGKYTFRVRVQQADGSWNPDELSVPLRINPSPWFSWPARLIYILLLLGLAYFAIRQFINMKVNREKLELSEQEKGLVEQISQERSTFFTNVSHEFRTPLSLIYGPVKELGKSPTLSENDRKLVGIVERNSERMLRLTDQLLHFNQSRENRDKLSVIRTDLTVLIRGMMKNFEYMFRQKNLQVSMELLPEQIVYCDREKVERIIFNLLSNAVKYTPEHGSIHVTSASDEGQAVISVADTGIGISPDKMEKIFDRYERLGEQVGNDIPSGFGIGLNYAKHLAVVHKGDLTVHANDPIGTVFTFYFPAWKESYEQDAIWQDDPSENAATDMPADIPALDGEKASLLIVEDNPDMREYIRGFLAEEFNVTLAGDGEEAWKIIRLSAPDLIISDVMMPFKDGYTLCKELKNDSEYCHIPIVLLTAKADMDNQLHGLELGADGYLGKPFDPAYLVAIVRNLLANRRRIQGILSEQTSTARTADTGVSPQDKAFLEKCWKIIDEHLSEEEFNVTMLSMEIGMSRTSVYTKLIALTGQSPQAYLTTYRLNKAMELLKEHELNIGEVAYKVGFSTHTGFSRAFKKKFGIAPSSV